MDEDRIEGTARTIGGKAQEALGRATGGKGAEAKAQMNQAAGAVQDLYGQGKDAARDSAASFSAWLRDTIEGQPYTATIAAIGLGWLLGRLHRPF